MSNNEIIFSEEEKKTILRLLKIEHNHIAHKLDFTKSKKYYRITEPLLIKSLSLLDKLSKFRNNQEANNLVITISAILWIYKNPKWDLLYENLILFLSRIGYGLSATMVDENYDFNTNKHTPLTSYYNEIIISIYNNDNEVNILDKTYLLTEFQKRVWDKIENSQLIGISAPTSAGKSYVILLKTIELIIREGGDVLYIVPTLSLISQVSSDFKKAFNQFNITNYEILNTYVPNNDNDKNYVYILTQERAISAFSQSQLEQPFGSVKVFIVDEIQNLERAAHITDLRAKTLYDFLIEFRHRNNANKLIISGPRIEQIGSLGEQIFGLISEEIDEKSSPVVNITYSISKLDNDYFFNQYSDFTKNPLSIKISNKEIVGYGKSYFNDIYNNFISEIIEKLGNESKNLVFAPTAPQARKIANFLSNNYNLINKKNVKINWLIDYLKDSVSDKYSLISIINNGFAYHHGKLPHHVRFVIEMAIKEKLINNVVCTTTLMQGVNLPTQNVIIRNPKLFVKRRKDEGQNPILTKYEIANLSGRAGRLLKDFIGRTFILDEDSFKSRNDDEQKNLFEKTTKKLEATYNSRFIANKDIILDSLINNSFKEGNENKFISCYIRQTLLKYGVIDSQIKLKSTGIEISKEELELVSMNLEKISVPKEVSFKNRYWDPFDLDKLYTYRENLIVPTSINENNIANSLTDLLQFMHDNFSFYFYRYLNMEFSENSYNYFLSLCIMAVNWAKETPLKKLIYDHSNPDQVENSIEKIQNTISYGIPILLKPVYDMTIGDHSLLTFIEMGAFKPITRRLIEFNIPRETAVYLSHNYFNKNEYESDNEIIEILKTAYPELNYWIKTQLVSII